jgi:hypothetical protein
MHECKHSGSQLASESGDRKVASDTMRLLACIQNRRRSGGEKEMAEQDRNKNRDVPLCFLVRIP